MISRRTFIALTPLVLAKTANAADHPSVIFMNLVAKELLHAHRQGTVSAFLRVIQRYADVSGIAQYSLGDYKVSSSQQSRYEHGVANFISRYFAEQSRNYPIAKFEIDEATVDATKDILVSSKVFLMSGQVYTVNWHLAWIDGKYKVVDAKFLGFSMTYQQRSMFTSYISKHSGDVSELIVALNR